MSEQTAFKLKGTVPADPSGVQTRRPDGTHRVVITGMGAISPAGVGVEALWDAVIRQEMLHRYDPSLRYGRVRGAHRRRGARFRSPPSTV